MNTKFNAKSFNAEAFGRYVERIPTAKKTELIKSGAVKANRVISSAFGRSTGTAYARLPMYGRIGGEPLNYDGQTDITPSTANTYERGVVAYGRSAAWTEMDFSYDITGGVDFMDNVAKQVAEYWAEVDQGVMLSILKGIFAMTGEDNAQFTQKHTYNIAEAGSGMVGAMSLNNCIQQASGDNKSRYSIVVMHSTVATNLENMQLLNYFTYNDKNGIQRDLSLASWNGRSVIVDDSLPIEKSGGEAVYTTYVLGEGAFDFVNAGAKNPFEMDRDAKTGGGLDILYSRQRKVLAPFGISYEKVSQASLSPTNEEFENGANWQLVSDGDGEYIDHKTIPIARIISKG